MMLTEVRERLEAALNDNELRGLVAEWRREGKSQVEVCDVFESFMLALRSEGRRGFGGRRARPYFGLVLA